MCMCYTILSMYVGNCCMYSLAAFAFVASTYLDGSINVIMKGH